MIFSDTQSIESLESITSPVNNCNQMFLLADLARQFKRYDEAMSYLFTAWEYSQDLSDSNKRILRQCFESYLDQRTFIIEKLKEGGFKQSKYFDEQIDAIIEVSNKVKLLADNLYQNNAKSISSKVFCLNLISNCLYYQLKCSMEKQQHIEDQQIQQLEQTFTQAITECQKLHPVNPIRLSVVLHYYRYVFNDYEEPTQHLNNLRKLKKCHQEILEHLKDKDEQLNYDQQRESQLLLQQMNELILDREMHHQQLQSMLSSTPNVIE